VSLRARPITIKAAMRLVEKWHRHLPRVVGGMFAVAAENGAGAIVGVAIVGRPVARLDQDGWTAEVVRCVTDGTRNANSFLYSTARRVAQTLGYRRLLTKTLPEESGSSLRALGLEPLGLTKAEGWHRPSRARAAPVNGGRKVRWDLLAQPDTGGTGK